MGTIGRNRNAWGEADEPIISSAVAASVAIAALGWSVATVSAQDKARRVDGPARYHEGEGKALEAARF